MKCEELESVIEEYFDGELDGHTAKLVEAHLPACASCAALYEELEREQALYARYTRKVEVSPALWTRVSARLAEEKGATERHNLGRQRAVAGLDQQHAGLDLRARLVRLFAVPRFSFSLTAALVLIAVGLTVAVMKYSGFRGGAPAAQERAAQDGAAVSAVQAPSLAAPAPSAGKDERAAPPEKQGVGLDADERVAENRADEQRAKGAGAGRKSVRVAGERERAAPGTHAEAVGPTVAHRAAGPNRQLTPDELVREAEQKYLAAIAILSRDVSRRRSRIDPQTLARFERTLAAVDRTIAGTRQAVRQHPNDPVAVQYMLTAYAKKVEVLREIASY